MGVAARMKMAHKLAMIVIVLLLPLSYVTVEYAVASGRGSTSMSWPRTACITLKV